MKDLGRIRRLFYRDGMSLSEIARKTGYSRNTVKRWLRTPEGTEPKYDRQNPNIKIAAYAARLHQGPGNGCPSPETGVPLSISSPEIKH